MENSTSNANTQYAEVGQVAENGIFVLSIRTYAADCVEDCCCCLAMVHLMYHVTLKGDGRSTISEVCECVNELSDVWGNDIVLYIS
jgi:hypothetical protein